MKKRRRARELVLQTLYGWEITGKEIDKLLEELCNRESNLEIQKFAVALVRKVLNEIDQLDKYISQAVKNWDYKRLALIDRIVLRMALCELLYFNDIPPKVSINEAIDLAKNYSTSKSGRFVNGIIDYLYNKLKSEGCISKEGKGLWEHKQNNIE